MSIRPLDVRKYQNREKLGQLEEINGIPDELMQMLIEDADFFLAARVNEVIDAKLGKMRERIIGVIWGHSIQIAASEKALLIKGAFSDPSYSGAVEWWLMDQLREEMPKHDWQVLTVVSPASETYHDEVARFALRHNFAYRDATDQAIIWEWQKPEPETV